MIYLLPRFSLFFLCWVACAAVAKFLWPADALILALLLGYFWTGLGTIYLRLARREPRPQKWRSRRAAI
jgi:hypothetical protein